VLHFIEIPRKIHGIKRLFFLYFIFISFEVLPTGPVILFAFFFSTFPRFSPVFLFYFQFFSFFFVNVSHALYKQLLLALSLSLTVLASGKS